MADLGRVIRAARELDDINRQEAADLAGVSLNTFKARENAPERFRLVELRSLAQGMSTDAKDMILRAVDSFFWSEDQL